MPDYDGPPCPADPEHGPLIGYTAGWYCPHEAHDGRPPTHPDGPAEPVRRWYRTEELA